MNETTPTASDYLAAAAARHNAVMERITLEAIDLEAAKHLDYHSDAPERAHCWQRSAYWVSVDGARRALLVSLAGWGKGWRIYTCRRRCDGLGLIAKLRGRDKRVLLERWLAETYSAKAYPTLEEIRAAREQQAREAAERDRLRAEERRRRLAEAEAEAARKQRELRIVVAGLEEIAALDLTNYQRSALAYAIGRLKPESGQ